MSTRMVDKGKILYPELSYIIYGCCFKTHNRLGRFRSERSYVDALEEEFKKENLKFVRERALAPSFDGEKDRRNIPDFIIEDKVVLDAKTKGIITKEDYFQMRRYLEISGKKLGLIINFRQKYIRPKRVAN